MHQEFTTVSTPTLTRTCQIFLQRAVWHHVRWTDGEHQEADQSNIEGDRQVEADVGQAAYYIGTAYIFRTKSPRRRTARAPVGTELTFFARSLLAANIFSDSWDRLPDTLGLFDAQNGLLFQPCAGMRHHVMATAAWDLKYHPRRRRRRPCALLENAIFLIRISRRAISKKKKISQGVYFFFICAHMLTGEATGFPSCQLNHAASYL